MSDRSKQRGQRGQRGLRVAGGLAAGAACAIVAVAGASPASAAPKPSPSPSVTTPPGLALHVDLPGLLQVHVDLPPLGALLGGGRTTTAPSPAVASPRPDKDGGSPVSRPTTVPSAAPTTSARPAPAPRTTAPAAVPRSSTPVGSGGGAGIDTARSGRPVRDATPTKARVAPDEVRKRAAEAFHRSVVPVAPLWLLLVVLGACAVGTATVVRMAGRRDRVGT